MKKNRILLLIPVFIVFVCFLFSFLISRTESKEGQYFFYRTIFNFPLPELEKEATNEEVNDKGDCINADSCF